MSETQSFKQRYHPDIAIFLILIPFISAFNYYLTYTNIQFNRFLILTFTIDTVQGYMAWWAVRWFILFLDRKFSFHRSFVWRIVLQIPSTLIIGLAIISLTTEMVSWIARGTPAPRHFYFVDLFIISIWFFVINGIYIGLYFYNEWKRAIGRKGYHLNNKLSGIVVKQGKMDLKVGYESIAGFYVDGEYAVVVTMEGRQYYIDQSLNQQEKEIPSELFFRLNRQYLVNRQIVSGFKRHENGKLVVMISHSMLPREIQVSRTKAPAFKGWFRP